MCVARWCSSPIQRRELPVKAEDVIPYWFAIRTEKKKKKRFFSWRTRANRTLPFRRDVGPHRSVPSTPLHASVNGKRGKRETGEKIRETHCLMLWTYYIIHNVRSGHYYIVHHIPTLKRVFLFFFLKKKKNSDIKLVFTYIYKNELQNTAAYSLTPLLQF